MNKLSLQRISKNYLAFASQVRNLPLQLIDKQD